MDKPSQSTAALGPEDARELIESAHCGLVVTDKNGKITFCNARFETWTGTTREALSTLRLRDLLDKVSQIYYDTHILPMLMLQGYVREIMCRMQPTKGDRMPILLNAELRPATNDRAARIEFTIFDATERSMYEADLRRARDDAEEFAAIVRSAAVAIMRVNRQGHISRWNRAAEEMFGFTASEAENADLTHLVRLKDQPDWVTAAIGAIQATKSLHRFECEGIDGQHFDVTVAAIATVPASGDPEHFSIILRDITKRVTNERRLKVVLRELNHRVKNTLAVVNSIARRTFVSPGTDSEKQQFEARLQALARAHDLLIKSDWESGSLREMVKMAIRDTGNETAFIIDGQDLQLPAAELTMLSMALFELTTNAFKYGALSSTDGKVHLTWNLSEGDPAVFTLDWIETGGPKVVEPTRRGFGSQMIERLLTAEMNGTSALSFDPAGLRYRLTAPFKGTF